jgi:hypothetical protein
MLAVVAVDSCGQATKKQAENFENYLIKENFAGQFAVGQRIPFPADNIQKKFLTIITEEGETKEPVYVVTENKQEIMQIIPQYDYEKGIYNDNIGEIIILSDKFKTAKGIGVNSTIKEFAEKYPIFFIWYSYISDMYVIETKSVDNVQFLLDETDFIGELEISGDMTLLKLSDFKPNAKISRIRILKQI